MIRILKLTAIFLGCSTWAQMPSAKSYVSEGQKFRVETIKQQSDVVWGFDFLRDGRIVFTERKGALKIIDPKTGVVTDISGPPKVWAEGQGGLLDVRVHPTQGDLIYLTYSEPVGDGATTAMGRGTLVGKELKNFKKLFTAIEANKNNIHFGSRMEFDGQGHVFFAIGDRNVRHHVQDLSFHTGKTIRLNEDGSIPKDNPFVASKGARPEIWSFGHRSPQGLVFHPVTKDLWLSEMGPKGGDELNLILPGKNYGWPDVTQGTEYWGPKIGVKAKTGTEEAVAFWVRSISPSGIAIYNGEVFPKWKGNLFIGTLSGTHLRRLILNGRKVVKQEELLKDLTLRIRHVRPGPDGLVYLSTDDGRVARLVPLS